MLFASVQPQTSEILSEADILTLPWAASPSDVDKNLWKHGFDFSICLLDFVPENHVLQFGSN